MIISIDVGIKNLAYIIYNNNEIIKWDVIELFEHNSNKVTMIEIGLNLYEKFSSKFSDFIFDKIIIENQIGKNAIRMKTLQGMITMYFISQGQTNIYYWNACNKLKDFDIPKKTTYNERKKYSIEITKKIIVEHYSDWNDFFLSHKKKDDLADCFLQLLHSEKNKLNINAINIK